jgi:hypothetical protein
LTAGRGEVGDEGEAVAADDASAPLDRAVAGEGEAFDDEDGLTAGEVEEDAGAVVGDGGADVFVAIGDTDGGAAGEEVVEGPLAEVLAEDGLAEVAGEPGVVDRERLLAGEAETGEVGKLFGRRKAELCGSGSVDGEFADEDSRVLLHASSDDGAGKAVEAVDGLFERRGAGEEAAAAALALDHAGGAKVTDSFADGVAADAVAADELFIGGKAFGELVGSDAFAEVSGELRPEGERA